MKCRDCGGSNNLWGLKVHRHNLKHLHSSLSLTLRKTVLNNPAISLNKLYKELFLDFY